MNGRQLKTSDLVATVQSSHINQIRPCATGADHYIVLSLTDLVKLQSSAGKCNILILVDLQILSICNVLLFEPNVVPYTHWFII
jgi:hypothetical protein